LYRLVGFHLQDDPAAVAFRVVAEKLDEAVLPVGQDLVIATTQNRVSSCARSCNSV